MGPSAEIAQQTVKSSDATRRSPPPAVASVCVLIPVLNAEVSIGPLIETLVAQYGKVYSQFEILLVNDGSTDGSQKIIEQKVQKFPGLVKGVRLSKNFGEHNAVMCGLSFVRADAVVIIDDDWQNPPSEIKLLVDKLSEGYDVVYCTYDQIRQSLFRRLGSAFANLVATRLLGKPKSLYLSSFKAMNSFLVRSVLTYKGPFPYLDGIILSQTQSIGQQRVTHQLRYAGRSNYDLSRLFRLWLNMFTGFSILPLRAASLLGFAVSVGAFFLSLFFIYTHFHGPVLINNAIPPGWASLIVAVTFLGGMQLCVLGLVGEYLGRLFLTINQLPQYIVKETLGLN